MGDRMDAAVEVAIRKWYADDASHTVEPWQVEYMRAALLAAMPVLLGEPVAYLARHPSVNAGRGYVLEGKVAGSEDAGWGYVSLYAPDLGGGK